MAKHKKWSPTIKFEIALLALKGEMTINDICKRYEIAPDASEGMEKAVA